MLLYCNRRGGSTWMLNAMAAHPRCRYVGRPFLTLPLSRHRKLLPSMVRDAAAHDRGDRTQLICIEPDEEEAFETLADDVINGRVEVYPTLNFRAPYFHRVTDRIILQMTSGGPLCEWFDDRFDVMTGILLRHPISNALSIMARGWRPHAHEYLENEQFVEQHLTGVQVDLGRRILSGDSDIARHVLDWTLKLLVPVRALESGRHPGWLAWTYEESVLDPAAIVTLIAHHFDFIDVDVMLEQAMRASRTVTPATAERLNDKRYLLSRWRRRVTPEDEAELLSIPAAFGMTMYEPGSDLPGEAYRRLTVAHRDETRLTDGGR